MVDVWFAKDTKYYVIHMSHICKTMMTISGLHSKLELQTASVATGQRKLEQERARICRELARLGTERRMALAATEHAAASRIKVALDTRLGQ